jgi:glycosyltransferase involved in cell wall biosynthesis
MAEGLRVALVAGTLGRGGAEKQLFLIARSLREAGADARVYSLTQGEVYERELRNAGIPVEPIGGGSLPAARLLALIIALRRFRPHVVQSCHTFVNLYAALAARATGSIGIGALRSTLSHARRANGAWTPLLMLAPAALIVNSALAAEEVTHSARRLRRPVFVVPNAIEIPRSLPERPIGSEGPVRVAFVGRLIPVKRLDLFLQAFAIARSEAPRLVAVVAGDGPELARMEALAADLGLSPPAVTFLGSVEAVGELLLTVDLLVLSSDEEGFPNVVLEAMTAALPVVATQAGDLGEAVQDGRTGFVVPVNDAAALAARIVELAKSPSLRRRLGGAAYERARDVYGARTLSGRLFAIYHELAERMHHQRTALALVWFIKRDAPRL